MKIALLALLCGFGFLNTSVESVHAADVPILNFVKVDDGVYRGGRPNADGIAALVGLGVKTIINLENEPAAIAAEKEATTQAGIDFISYSMDYKTAPDPTRVNHILDVLDSPSSKPVYVHCKHGQDRTGLIIGLYRMRTDHWTGKDAYAEMLANHFHPMFKNLVGYFQSQE